MQFSLKRLMCLIFQYAPEPVVIIIIFKLNLLSSLINCHQSIVFNKIPMTSLNIECLMMSIRTLVYVIDITMNVLNPVLGVHPNR